ncbi:DUF4326 domain-containing protein [Tersicoccus sp. MR15.9]|uniref:DUF4326 domain-containing protein n=1 Tax=Tersicoccus mangrovi TaxID=3121635 RepID=UPI002FE653E6
MSAPRRVQRRPGTPVLDGSVFVGRGAFTNPFAPARIPGWSTASRHRVVEDYRRWLTEECWQDPRNGILRSVGGSHPDLLGVPYTGRPSLEAIRAHLAGVDLACWCPESQPCHADVLLHLANA